MDHFLTDVIHAYKLSSPTVVAQDHNLPEVCMTLQWVLCLTNTLEDNTTELVGHISNIDSAGRQDGLILIGREHHYQLLKSIEAMAPAILTSKPAFVPLIYHKNMSLRLDSSIVLYEENADGNIMSLRDIFAVKGGQPIILELGSWDR